MKSASTLQSILSSAAFISLHTCCLIPLAGPGKECLYSPPCFNMTEILHCIVMCTGVNCQCKACSGRVKERETAKSAQPCLCCPVEHFLESVTHRLMHRLAQNVQAGMGQSHVMECSINRVLCHSASSCSHVLFIV